MNIPPHTAIWVLVILQGFIVLITAAPVGGLVHEWQALITGVLALGGAGITVKAIRDQISSAERQAHLDRRIAVAALNRDLVHSISSASKNFSGVVVHCGNPRRSLAVKELSEAAANHLSTHFDPDVIELFVRDDAIKDIYEHYLDDATAISMGFQWQVEFDAEMLSISALLVRRARLLWAYLEHVRSQLNIGYSRAEAVEAWQRSRLPGDEGLRSQIEELRHPNPPALRTRDWDISERLGSRTGSSGDPSA